ncbi:MAG: hypothetical protein IH571_07120 [Acholeplasmataceae bacterium]|nr:hypothetical protein [Acholeplasmataceae bacterium]
MKKLQLLTYICALIVAGVYFLFTLSFSSGWAIGQMFGEFYTEAQIANRAMFDVAKWAIIFAFLGIVFQSHKNRNFFLSNYVLSAASVATMIISGLTTLKYMEPLKIMYLDINEEILDLISQVNYSNIGTHMFELGTYLSFLLFVQAAWVLVFTILKFRQNLIRAKAKKLAKVEVSL